MQNDDISIIVEVAAEASPTASGLKKRAATHQYAKPNTDVTTIVPISEPVLNNMALFFLIH